MIYHQKDAGAIRTQPTNSDLFECQVCGTTWTAKLDVWQDCTPWADVLRDVTAAPDVKVIEALPPGRDPRLPRSGMVVERVVEVIPVVARARRR